MMNKDRKFIERKMEHYNSWLKNNGNNPNSKYPGFPEEIAIEFARKEFVQDFLFRQKNKKAKNEKTIRSSSTKVSAKSSQPSSAKQQIL